MKREYSIAFGVRRPVAAFLRQAGFSSLPFLLAALVCATTDKAPTGRRSPKTDTLEARGSCKPRHGWCLRSLLTVQNINYSSFPRTVNVAF